jgi:hypothetical protein
LIPKNKRTLGVFSSKHSNRSGRGFSRTFLTWLFLIILILATVFAYLSVTEVKAVSPSKVVFISGKAQTLSTYQMSAPITIQLQDGNNNPVTIAKHAGSISVTFARALSNC